MSVFRNMSVSRPIPVVTVILQYRTFIGNPPTQISDLRNHHNKLPIPNLPPYSLPLHTKIRTVMSIADLTCCASTRNAAALTRFEPGLRHTFMVSPSWDGAFGPLEPHQSRPTTVRHTRKFTNDDSDNNDGNRNTPAYREGVSVVPQISGR